jgi:hypothetical protein
MYSRFNGCERFNQPLEAWSVDQVRDMNGMFQGAAAFNQPLQAWSVDQVTNMSGMFGRATAFNQPLGAWRVDRVTTMRGMFWGAAAFNRPLEAWRVDRVATIHTAPSSGSTHDVRAREPRWGGTLLARNTAMDIYYNPQIRLGAPISVPDFT